MIVIASGSDKVNTIYGYGGNDVIFGMNGNDFIYSGEGDDIIIGGGKYRDWTSND